MKLGMPQLYEYDTIEENLILAKQLNLDFIDGFYRYDAPYRKFEDKQEWGDNNEKTKYHILLSYSFATL